MRRIRFGVLAKQARPAQDFADLARKAEALGFSTLYVPDHFVDHPLAPIPAMATAAAVTDDLRVGSLVLGNDYKHPVVLARELATIDLLSDGRLEAGLGAGWMTADYEKAGIPLDPPGVRISRLVESVAIVKGLFADGPFSFSGEHYTITELDGHPKPVQQPVPFVIGGGGERVLSYAAREADVVGINANLKSGDPNAHDAAISLSGPSTDQKVDWVRAAAGPRFDDIELQSLVGFVLRTEDPGALAERVGGSFGVAADEALHTPVLLIGTVDAMVDELRYRRDRWGFSYHVFPEEFLDIVTPVVARLAGT
jgi:probable F420-dependent oxidoreductase